MAAFAPFIELTAETVPKIVSGRAAGKGGLVTLDTVEHPVGVGFHLGLHRGTPFRYFDYITIVIFN